MPQGLERVDEKHPGPTVVLGLGNSLMGDDGLGLIALERLASRSFAPPVEFVDGGVWGLSLLPDVERAGSLLILDAVHGAGQPGALYMLTGEEVPRLLSGKISPHQVDVRELLALAELRQQTPRRLMVVGLQPASVDYAAGLSAPVAGALDRMVAAAEAVLTAWGHHPAQDRQA